MDKPNFDFIAPWYDLLASLVFGNRLQEAATVFFDKIEAHEEIVIVGGGSGKILESLCKYNFKGCVTYVEASAKMIQLAKASKPHKLKVIFVNTPIENFTLQKQTATIITPFFLDMYAEKALDEVIKQLSKTSSANSKWLLADFSISKSKAHQLWQKPLIRLMYLFFKLVAGVSANQLPKHQKVMENNGWRLKKRKAWLQSLVISELWVYKL